jgi:hypothetical protein
MSARIRIAVLFASVVATFVWFYAFDPARTDAFLPCPFFMVTGMSCPGCGTQRAVHLFLHGEFFAALRSNPLALLLVPVVGYLFFAHFADDAFGRSLPELRMRYSVVWLSAAIIAAYWIARNMSWWWWPLS